MLLKPTLETPLIDFGFGRMVNLQLSSMSLYYVEDLVHVSEVDLFIQKQIGSRTVERLRKSLEDLGLCFMPNKNPVVAMHDRAKKLRKMTVESRACLIALDAEVSVLGLSRRAITACIRCQLFKVQDLLALKPRQFNSNFGRATAQELFKAICDAGLTLNSQPARLEIWRCGLLLTSDMDRPGEDASVVELQPWLASIALVAKRQGVGTVGELRSIAQQKRKIKGIGEASMDQIAAYFELPKNKIEASDQIFNAWGPAQIDGCNPNSDC
jgi:hypothetical protein